MSAGDGRAIGGNGTCADAHPTQKGCPETLRVVGAAVSGQAGEALVQVVEAEEAGEVGTAVA